MQRSSRMTRYTLDLLEGLQNEINELDFRDDSSDTDSISLKSQNTKATSIQLENEAKINLEIGAIGAIGAPVKQENVYIQFSGSTSTKPKPLPPLPFGQKASFLGDRIGNSALVLECLHDMVLQENAIIEASLAELCGGLIASKGMNTFEISRDSLFPLGKK